ncbi:MAG TPA: PDZ domain-containing protein, partial [Tepidisphaeraceae bacterium]|nr:PDZ domain-containing protein [Tepidisphaeraceae bacterium]
MSGSSRLFAKAALVLALSAGPAMAQNPFDAPPPAGPRPANPFEGPGAPATPPRFAGAFSDGQTTLTLAPDPAAAGAYRGAIARGGREFPIVAQERDGKLVGQFAAGENKFDFTATLDGGTVTMVTGRTTYKLAAAGAPAPAANGGGPVAPAGKPGGVGMAIRLMEDNTIRVMGVKPGGPAEKAGVRAGDQLLAIDGKDASGFRDPTEPIKGAAGTDVKLTVVRDGQRADVTVTREAMEIPPNRIGEVRDNPNPGGGPNAPAGPGGNTAGVA